MSELKSCGTCGMGRMFNAKQMAELFGIHTRTVWRLASLAEIGQSDFPKPMRIAPKTVRWRSVDVEKYIALLANKAGSRGGL